jgi:hypothetical protein
MVKCSVCGEIFNDYDFGFENHLLFCNSSFLILIDEGKVK